MDARRCVGTDSCRGGCLECSAGVLSSDGILCPRRRVPVLCQTCGSGAAERLWSVHEDQLAYFQYVLGPALLDFLLARKSDADASLLGPQQQATLVWLAENLAALEAEDPRLPMALARRQGEQGLSMAWTLRSLSGAPPPSLDAHDPVARDLQAVARDCYPALLGPADLMLQVGPGRAVPAAPTEIGLAQLAGGHAKAPALDAGLAELTQSAPTMAVVAAGLSVDLRVSTEDVLSAALRRRQHAVDQGPGAFMHMAVEVLDEIRRLVAGETVQVAALIGFVGLPLGELGPRQLPGGTLRAATESESGYAPFSLLADGVLVTTVPARACAPEEVEHQWIADQEKRLIDAAREVILGAALGSPEPVPHTCPAVAWTTVLPPLGISSAMRPLHPAGPPLGRRQPLLTPEELAGLEHWARMLAQVDLSPVAIGIDRLLRALWELEPTDSLIDAVITWENLLGTRSETVFRVTAALAVLCVDDPDQRLGARKRLGKVYDARSRLVHGEPPPDSVHEQRAEAVRVALEALRRLIRDRPDLLALRESSARTDRLLLAVG